MDSARSSPLVKKSVLRNCAILPLLAATLVGCNASLSNPIGAGDDATPAWYPNGAVPTPAAKGNSEPLPDLTVDHDMLLSSLTFGQESRPDDDCAVVEGCLVGGNTPRRVLRFDVGVMNVGQVDLHMGNPANNPQDFEYSTCHQHYHYKGFAEYTLKNASGVVATTGAKRAFCLMDIHDWGTSNPEGGGYNCDNQGISVGWEDVYDQSLDCQWLDITDVAAGQYSLSVTVNAQGRIPEGGNAPNTVSVPVSIN